MTDRNIHEEFRRAMQEAWEEAVIDTSELKDEDIPAPDLSFLDHLSEEEPLERGIELPVLKADKKRRRANRFTKVAAAVLAICIISSAMGIFVNSETSYGIRSFVQNIRHLVFENEPEIIETGSEYLPVTDWDEIDNGKKVVGTLYIPEYIPKGYTFQKAEFTDVSGGMGDGTLDMTYNYKNGEKLLMVTIWKVANGSETSVLGELEQSPISGRDMYVALDEERKEYVITCVEQDLVFFVSAPVSKYEAFKIIEGIKKQDN